MARIYVTDKRQVRELTCLVNGKDIMGEVMEGANEHGNGKYTSETDEADWEMPEWEYCWWEAWAREEQALAQAGRSDGPGSRQDD